MRTDPFRFCLNTSTIAGQRLGVIDQITLAGKCGYDGIEVWMRSLHEHVEVGGTLAEVTLAAQTAGVVIENVIGFVPWAVDDPSQREAGLSEAAKDLAMLEQIGCRRLAAPPFGATEVAVGFDDLAKRFDGHCCFDRLGRRACLRSVALASSQMTSASSSNALIRRRCGVVSVPSS
jgi:2-keto-myo-inositol isomerase